MECSYAIKRNNFTIKLWGFTIVVFCSIFLIVGALAAIYENGNSRPLSMGQDTRLSLNDAVQAALKNNITALLAEAKTEAARGKILQSASYLLPHVLLNVQQSRVFKENLAEMGFSSWGVIGPYNAFDGRIQLVQQIFDWSAAERLRAEQINVKIAQLDEELAAKQVRTAASLAYLNTLSAQEDMEAALADLDLARQLLKLGRRQNLAGLATSIDVARFETRAAEEEAGCLRVTMNLHKARIELNRVIGLPLDTRLKLTDAMGFGREQIFSVAEGINFADQNRTELKIAGARIQYRELKLKEARSERLPSVGLMGDYGLGGDSPSGSLRSVGEIGAVFKMPLFDGGLIKGEIEEAESDKRQSRLIFDDLAKQIEEDVHLALQSFLISTKQVRAAKKVLVLAQRELTMARDLFSAGIGDNIEVINAQTALARSRQQYVAVVFQYNAARVNLYSALGNIETFSLSKKRGK